MPYPWLGGGRWEVGGGSWVYVVNFFLYLCEYMDQFGVDVTAVVIDFRRQV